MVWRNVLLATLLVAAAAASWYFRRPQTEPPPADGSAPPPLGFSLREARLVGTDDDGHLTYTVTAVQAVEAPDREGLLLDDVRVEYVPQAEIAWALTAERAAVPTSGTPLTLSGDVELRREPPAGGGPTTLISAQELVFHPTAFFAESAGPVRLAIGDDVLEAVGLEAHLKDDRLTLESQVHARFVP